MCECLCPWATALPIPTSVFNYFFICVCACVCMCKSFFYHLAYSEDQTQAISLNNKHFYLQSHLTQPFACLDPTQVVQGASLRPPGLAVLKTASFQWGNLSLGSSEILFCDSGVHGIRAGTRDAEAASQECSGWRLCSSGNHLWLEAVRLVVFFNSRGSCSQPLSVRWPIKVYLNYRL